MNVQRALNLINSFSFWPGWKITAELDVFSSIFQPEPLIEVTYEFEASDSDSKYAPDYPVKINPDPRFLLDPSLFDTEDGVRDVVFSNLLEVVVHEAREFFKVGADYASPYHPHTAAGDEAWDRLGLSGFKVQNVAAARG